LAVAVAASAVMLPDNPAAMDATTTASARAARMPSVTSVKPANRAVGDFMILLKMLCQNMK
jgi:hypothetical protein